MPAFLDWLRQQSPDVQAPLAAPTAPADTPAPAPTAPAFNRDAYLSDLKGAQSEDQAARDTLAKRVQWASWLGNGLDPKAVELSMPHRAANLGAQMDAGKSLDEQTREAQAFGPKLRTMTAQAGEAEATAPFAARRAQADIATRESQAALEQQKADTGRQTMTAQADLLRESKDPDSLTSQVGRQLAEQAGLKVPPTAPYYAFQHLLPDAVKQKIAEVRAEGMMQAARTRATIIEGGVALTPKAVDQAAQTYLQTGQLPQLGMGRSGAAVKTKIANRAAEIDPEANLAGNRAGYGADKASLQKLQTQADAVDAFERTAMSNLDRFLQTATSVVDTGSPLFNMPARKFAESVAGDPKLTQFNVARQVAVQEIGKVLSGAMGNAAISDSARKEVGELLSPDASLAQIKAAADILRQDMANRKTAYAAAIGEVRARSSGKTTKPEAAAPAVRTFRRGPDGKLVEVKP